MDTSEDFFSKQAQTNPYPQDLIWRQQIIEVDHQQHSPKPANSDYPTQVE